MNKSKSKPDGYVLDQIKWLTRQLPPIADKVLTQELECYGAKKIIATAMRFPETLASTATWQHGWQWDPITHVQQLAGGSPPEIIRLVATEEHAKFLRQRGYSNVHAVGVPFIYASCGKTQRRAGSLLVMPPHSLAWTSHEWNEKEYVEYVVGLQGRFSEVVACISGPCIDHGYWISTFEEAGIPWVRGASASDQNGLRRMQIIFRSFEYMTTNTMGSHVAYASCCGCKVSIAGPYSCPQRSEFARDEPYIKAPDYLTADIDRADESSVRHYYPHLFCSPDKAELNVQWAEGVLGKPCKRDPREIALLFGWPRSIRHFMRQKARGFARQEGWPGYIAGAMIRVVRLCERGGRLIGNTVRFAEVGSSGNEALGLTGAAKVKECSDDSLVREISKNLPVRRVRELKQELDCYGIKGVIARAIGLSDNLPSVVEWVHGWQWDPITCVQQLGEVRDVAQCRLVATKGHAEFLESHGLSNIHAVGMPILYVPAPNVKRIPRSLLVMPPHSLAWTEHKWAEQEYVQYVLSIKPSFACVVACISSSCIDHGYWCHSFEKGGIPWIRGAEAADQNALLRQRRILGMFEFMTTNTMGSHVAYAALSGCKVSIAGRYVPLDPSAYKNDGFYQAHPEVLEANVTKSSELVVRQYYPELFCDPARAIQRIPWAERVLGKECMRPPREIAGLLGWPENTRQLLRSRARRFARRPGWPSHIAGAVIRMVRSVRGEG